MELELMSGLNLDDPNFVGNILGNPDDPQTSLSGEEGAFSTVLIPLGSWESKPQITDGPPGFGGDGLAPHISLRLGLGVTQVFVTLAPLESHLRLHGVWRGWKNSELGFISTRPHTSSVTWRAWTPQAAVGKGWRFRHRLDHHRQAESTPPQCHFGGQ